MLTQFSYSCRNRIEADSDARRCLEKQLFHDKAGMLFFRFTRIPNEGVMDVGLSDVEMVASYLARISVTEAVSPGRSSPVTRIRISSVLNGCISCLLIGYKPQK